MFFLFVLFGCFFICVFLGEVDAFYHVCNYNLNELFKNTLAFKNFILNNVKEICWQS